MSLRSYQALLPADIIHMLSEVHTNPSQYVFNLYPPHLGMCTRDCVGFCNQQTLLLTEEPYWEPEDKPLHQGVANYSPLFTTAGEIRAWETHRERLHVGFLLKVKRGDTAMLCVGYRRKVSTPLFRSATSWVFSKQTNMIPWESKIFHLCYPPSSWLSYYLFTLQLSKRG